MEVRQRQQRDGVIMQWRPRSTFAVPDGNNHELRIMFLSDDIKKRHSGNYVGSE